VAGSTSKKGNRREAAAELRRAAERAERNRTRAIIAACAVVALILIALPAYKVIRDRQQVDQLAGLDLAGIGVPAAKAGCTPVSKEAAEGSQQHEPDGTPIAYDQAPPAYGPHYGATAPFGRTFYTANDRPPLGNLVHNLEHGYSILWYDEAAADNDDDVALLRAIAAKFSAESFDPTKKFIVAPYTADDPGSFPAGKPFALTHWSAAFEQGAPVNQEGVTQYCEQVSGEVVEQFVRDFPYTDSPEPGAA
jgi:hypothetical protein